MQRNFSKPAKGEIDDMEAWDNPAGISAKIAKPPVKKKAPKTPLAYSSFLDSGIDALGGALGAIEMVRVAQQASEANLTTVEDDFI